MGKTLDLLYDKMKKETDKKKMEVQRLRWQTAMLQAKIDREKAKKSNEEVL